MVLPGGPELYETKPTTFKVALIIEQKDEDGLCSHGPEDASVNVYLSVLFVWEMSRFYVYRCVFLTWFPQISFTRVCLEMFDITKLYFFTLKLLK